MKAFNASILLSGGSANATSTASFSSSGLAGVVIVVLRSVDRTGVVELSARASLVLFVAAGGAFAPGLLTGGGVFSTIAARLSVFRRRALGDALAGTAVCAV